MQRVSSARAEVDGEAVGAIDGGFLVLLGVARGDGEGEAVWLADKVAGLRVFEDEAGKMNLSLQDTGGSVLVVSQFTLLGDCRRGRRPSFTEAAPPEEADRLYRRFVARLREVGLKVETGVFQAHMAVSLVNEGPVTLVVETPEG